MTRNAIAYRGLAVVCAMGDIHVPAVLAGNQRHLDGRNSSQGQILSPGVGDWHGVIFSGLFNAEQTEAKAMNIIRAGIEHIDDVTPLFDLYRQFYEQAPDAESCRTWLKSRLEADESIVFLATTDI